MSTTKFTTRDPSHIAVVNFNQVVQAYHPDKIVLADETSNQYFIFEIEEFKIDDLYEI